MNLRLGPAALVQNDEFAEWMIEEDVDLLLNVHSLHLACASVVRAPRIGSFNLHPGPLPRYAGLNAPSWAIYNGETEHGVTVHWMDPEIDTGAIAYQSRFPLRSDDTGVSLSTRCVELGLTLVSKLLDAAAADPASIPVRAQDLSERTYYGRGAPHEGRVCWSWTAGKIERFVRASDFFPLESPWGSPSARLEARPLEIVRVALTGERCNEPPGSLRHDGPGVSVATADEWLRLMRLRFDGESGDPSQLLAGHAALSDG
jgi:UDP-4-amino-4-deoxy-L-arabinose formyltransferase/UDP-glucuronic acid dehydrogenase (UDP-4-keto-hexauronic acid decarboxylating)